ncbi:DUF2798 domain-containing protein [Asticcacaulis currens]
MLFPRLPARYGAFALPFILSIFMTFVVSLISTLKAVGVSAGFIGH